MRFKYQKIPVSYDQPWKSLPLIPIRVFNEKQEFLDVNALLDSGAEKSMANLEIANELKIDLFNSKVEKFAGIDNIPLACFVIDIEIQVIGDNKKIKIPVGFIKELPFAFILGREKFFDYYIITFNQRKEEIELKRN